MARKRTVFTYAPKNDLVIIRAIAMRMSAWSKTIGTAEQTLPPAASDIVKVTALGLWSIRLTETAMVRTWRRAERTLPADVFAAAWDLHSDMWDQKYNRSAYEARKLRADAAALNARLDEMERERAVA